MQAPGLELRGIRFAFGDWELDVDLSVENGSVTALLGGSGAGKSTLLALAAGFERPIAGSTLVHGQAMNDLLPSRRPIATLFQEHNLFPHLTAFKNVALGIDPGLRLTQRQKEQVISALARVGLVGKEWRLPKALSGGERRRVAIARVLVMQRSILLLDEPFAALGPSLRQEMLDLVDSLRRDRGLTVLMVTHDPADALRIASATAFMHDGRILAVGPTRNLLESPSCKELADYLDAPYHVG